MIEILLSREEGKNLEFKENTSSLQPIVRTIVAFANTAGGVIVIGVQDKTKKVIGVANILLEEERLTNIIAESIQPLLIPDIQIQSFRNRELLVIHVPHMIGPFYLKSAGLERGTYIRLGSSNRLADHETILSLQMLAKNISFDELPYIGSSLSDLNETLIAKQLSYKFSNVTRQQYSSLGILTRRGNQLIPTHGGILLFAKNRLDWFPDSLIRCVYFSGETRVDIVDQLDIKSSLIDAIDEILMFIRRHTRVGAKIGTIKREDIYQYPPQALREAIINALVHANYAIKGSSTQVAIFSNRIEITNPGGLPYGQTIQLALSGVSLMRNRMMGRIFREIELIERLGTGLKRIIEAYRQNGLQQPEFQDMDTYFRVILYSVDKKAQPILSWQKELLEIFSKRKSLSTSEIAKIWEVTTRTARNRLALMLKLGLIEHVGTSIKDPYGVYKIRSNLQKD